MIFIQKTQIQSYINTHQLIHRQLFPQIPFSTTAIIGDQLNKALTQFILQMQAYIDNDEKDKGLFTFYLQQAQLQQKLKEDKKLIQHPQYHRKKQKKPTNFHHRQKHQDEDPASENLRADSVKPEPVETQRKEENMTDDSLEKRKKLVELLERQKYKARKMKNIRLIMGDSQIEDEEYQYRLQELLHEKRKQDKDNKELLLSEVQPKEQPYQGHYSPFRKLYLPPKNFDTYFHEQMIGNSRRAVQPLKTKSYESHLFDPKKIEQKPQEKSIQFIQKKETEHKSFQQIYQKHLLPKLDFRCVSQIGNEMVPSSQLERYQSKSNRAKKQLESSFDNQRSERYRQSKQDSLCIQSARYHSEKKSIDKSALKKVYPVFLQNDSNLKYEEESKMSKQKIYMDILKKLKFK